ncbi:MAG: class II SORL domain-containing protein [Candidatus Zixiibacteriota bacterium]
MSKIQKLYQEADWKKEKHVPVIELSGIVGSDSPIQVQVSVGKEIGHPNTTEHFIQWMEIYFHPEGEKFPYLIGRFDLAAHGASVDGPDSSTVYTDPNASVIFRTKKSGTIIANSYCNIHGLWTNTKELEI